MIWSVSDVQLLRVTILVAGFYFYYLTFRYLRTRQRHTADMNHYKSILFGTKEDSPVCWNKHNTLRIVFSSWSPHGKPQQRTPRCEC